MNTDDTPAGSPATDPDALDEELDTGADLDEEDDVEDEADQECTVTLVNGTRYRRCTKLAVENRTDRGQEVQVLVFKVNTGEHQLHQEHDVRLIKRVRPQPSHLPAFGAEAAASPAPRAPGGRKAVPSKTAARKAGKAQDEKRVRAREGK